MHITVPTRLRQVCVAKVGQEWLDSLPKRVARAVDRWDLVLGEPFEEGITAWTAPAKTAAGLAAWHAAGAVELLAADAEDSALLLRRLRPGSTLRDERLPPVEHLTVGAELLRRMAAVPIPAGEPFRDLVRLAGGLAVTAAERVERLLPTAPIPIDTGLCRHAVDLLRTLPGESARRGSRTGTSTRAISSASSRRESEADGSRSTRSRSTVTWPGTRGRC